MFQSDADFKIWLNKMDLALNQTETDRPDYERYRSANAEIRELLLAQAQLREDKALALYRSESVEKPTKSLAQVETRLDNLGLLIAELKARLPEEAFAQLLIAETDAINADRVEQEKVAAAKARSTEAMELARAAADEEIATIAAADRVHGKTFSLQQAIRYHQEIFAVESAIV